MLEIGSLVLESADSGVELDISIANSNTDPAKIGVWVQAFKLKITTCHSSPKDKGYGTLLSHYDNFHLVVRYRTEYSRLICHGTGIA